MKLIEDVTCPNCKKDFTKETDLDKLDKAEPIQTTKATISGTQQILEKPIEKPVETKIETVIEDFKPNYECPDEKCQVGLHKNENYSKKVKGKCTNCDQFTKYDMGQCPWCKKTDTIEEMDPEDLEDLGIENPPEVMHKHE